MNTIVYEITDVKKDIDKIKEAAQIIRDGGLVAFPTETVYGLGASMENEVAIKRIFEVKGRPTDNPMIVHLGRDLDVHTVVDITQPNTPLMSRLIENFWPGPLTIIMPRILTRVPSVVTAGLLDVAVRMPDNDIARALIVEADVPMVAPSANLSGRPSPTKPEHVLEDLDGKVDMILLGGDCTVGIESTVISLAGENPVIVRPGAITLEQIQELSPRKVLVDPRCYPLFEGETVR